MYYCKKCKLVKDYADFDRDLKKCIDCKKATNDFIGNIFFFGGLISIFLAIWSCGIKQVSADIQKGGSTGTLGRDMSHISVGSLPLQKIEVYKGGRLIKIWEDLETPTITAFDVVPKNLDLDTTPTGTIVFTIGVTGTPGTSTPTASNFVFASRDLGVLLIYGNTSTLGTRSISSAKIANVWFYPGTYGTSSSPRNIYEVSKPSILTPGTPSVLTIDGTDYNLTQHQRTTSYRTGVIPSGDRVSNSDLTKAIQITFADGSKAFNTITPGTGNTYAQVVRLPDGTNIGPTQTATGGASINTTVSNIPQPNQTTTYRLFVHNTGGGSHKDTTITVTKNPTLANCRRTGVITRTNTYFFGFILTGLPRPTVTYAFSGGQTGTVSDTHLTQGANPYTWTSSGWQIIFPNSNAQSLTLTATNSSGSVTCRIANINA